MDPVGFSNLTSCYCAFEEFWFPSALNYVPVHYVLWSLLHGKGPRVPPKAPVCPAKGPGQRKG